jgi:Flp pilus assembly pilin Flp
MWHRLNQRGAMAFEEALLGVLLTLGCIGSFVAISRSVSGVIGQVFVEYNSFGLGSGCTLENARCGDFLPVQSPPLTSDLDPNAISAGVGQPGGGTP